MGLFGDIRRKRNSNGHGPDSAPALAIGDSFLRRLIILLALKTTARFYERIGPCIPISKHLVVKTSPFVDLTEAATMQFLASKTSIPVPRVYCAFVHRHRAYIVMERIQGDTMGRALQKLSATERTSVFTQLRRMLVELRSLPAPSDRIESCVGGSLRDSRIPHAGLRFGPFDTTQKFHAWLRKGVRLEDLHDGVEDRASLEKMMIQQDGPWPSPTFTHGDLNSSNILVRDGQVVGIIDWEFAGWYPSYWEYTSAWIGSQTRKAWQDMVADFLDPCPRELEMEITRERWWGEG